MQHLHTPPPLKKALFYFPSTSAGLLGLLYTQNKQAVVESSREERATHPNEKKRW